MNVKSVLPKLYRIAPFLLILVVAAAVLERQKTSDVPPDAATPLLPPEVDIASLDTRASEVWDFTLPDLSGKEVHLSDFKGKVVLMNFFGTWCPPCREEMPSIEKLFQTNKDRGFVVLGIAGDPGGKKRVAPFVEEFKLTFPVLLDPYNKVSSQYFVRGLPITYLLDRQGHIASMYRGGADWSSPRSADNHRTSAERSGVKMETGVLRLRSA